MNTKKIIIIFIVGIISFPIIAFFYKNWKYGHSSSPVRIEETDLSIFKKDEIERLGEYSGLYYNKSDILNNYKYIKDPSGKSTFLYFIAVWEFKNKQKIHFEDIKIQKDVMFDPFKKNYEILSLHTSLEKKVKLGCDFKTNFKVIIDVSDSIVGHIDGRNYKGVYGYFYNILITDNNDAQALIMNKAYYKKPSTLLLAKKNNSIYLIFIVSDYKEDSNKLVDIFDFG